MPEKSRTINPRGGIKEIVLDSPLCLNPSWPSHPFSYNWFCNGSLIQFCPKSLESASLRGKLVPWLAEQRPITSLMIPGKP